MYINNVLYCFYSSDTEAFEACFRLLHDDDDDDEKEDAEFCEKFLLAFQRGFEPDDKKVQRLGRRNTDGTYRPILIQLRSGSVKNYLIESLYKIRQFTRT